jgi:uncharacterized Rossmann fold enzyme
MFEERIKEIYKSVKTKYLFSKEELSIKKDVNLKKILSKNLKFKSSHSGKRCFILGNGPSLKTDNLKCLEDEFVFTVNQIARHPDFKYIKPNYHFWADPLFFNIDKNKETKLYFAK